MSEILGHDCDGRPLRAGDTVTIVRSSRPGIIPVGTRCKVVGVSAVRKGELAVNVAVPGAREVSGPPEYMRRCDRRDDAGSWDEIQRATGWSPDRIAVTV